MKTYYDLIPPNSLVFDIGANLGEETAKYRKQNARIIAVEPQPRIAQVLRERYKNDSNVIVVEKGVSNQAGHAIISISDSHTISTFSDKWKTGRFSGTLWPKKVSVEMTTLDDLIAQYGKPFFCKIDVEGFEANVLQGLSQSLPLLSFEYCAEFHDESLICLKLLEKLGMIQYSFSNWNNPNISVWTNQEDLLKIIKDKNDNLLCGDIYVTQKQ